jgi:aminoglycoside phosphotransferase (APT) family kinase protein
MSVLPLPTTIATVDAAWLTGVLRDDGTLPPDATVTAARSERIALETGFSSELWRVHLQTDTAGAGPASVIVKLPTSTAVRQAMDMVGGYAREVAFYRDVAGRGPLATPRVHLARQAADGTDFVLVLEDLGAWENGNHFAGLPLDRARACLGQLAALHAWSAAPERRTELGGSFPSLDSPVTRQAFPLLAGEGWQQYVAHARTPVPPAVDAFVTALPERIGALLEALTEREVLLHGDIRADNLFFRGDDLAIVDFQLAAWGSGLVDVGYLVSQGLTPAERGGRDAELVREYLAALVAAGGPAVGFEEAWRHYRQAVALMLIFPLVAVRGWDALPPNARELCLRLVERSVATIVETDALAVVA